MKWRPLNVWRIYVDLYSNFMGLVVLGGVGLMIMIGGAVLHASSGFATFPKRCSDDAQVLAFAQSGIDRMSKIDKDSCEVSAQYPDIQYRRAQTQFTGNKKGLDAICRDFRNLVRFAQAHQNQTHPIIEVMGHASNEFTHTEACGTGEHATLEDWKNFKKYAERLGISVPTQDDPEQLERYLCNAGIALQRAADIVRKCSAFPHGSVTTGLSGGVPDFVTMVADPHNLLSGEGEICSHPITNSLKEECQRTVTLRLRLPPKNNRHRKTRQA